MNAIIEIAVIASAVGIATLFVALRVIKALRGGRPSCCSDAGEAGILTSSASCADADANGLAASGLDASGDGRNLKPRPSYCAGCTGCEPRG